MKNKTGNRLRRAAATLILSTAALALIGLATASTAEAARMTRYVRRSPHGKIMARAFVVAPRNGVRANTRRVYRRARLNPSTIHTAPPITAPKMLIAP